MIAVKDNVTKKITSIAVSEYVKWITNPKLSLIIVMLIFIYEMYISKMVEAANAIGSKVSFLEPFIAVCNSVVLLLVIPSMYLGIMGDFPRVDGNSMFYLQRVGKINWILGQILFAIMSAITYIAIVFMGTTLPVVMNCNFSDNWSETTTKYMKYFPEKSEDLVTKLIDGKLYNNMVPSKAFILSFTLMVIYMVLINMVLMVGFTIGKHSLGIAGCAAMICVSCASVEFGSKSKWILPTANVLSWQHFDEIYKKQVVNIELSYAYFIIMITILVMLSVIFIDNYDFSKISEMEE